MNRFVLDCSVAMAWCFGDEADAYSDRVLEELEQGTALVPCLWSLEVANVLLVAERRGRLLRRVRDLGYSSLQIPPRDGHPGLP